MAQIATFLQIFEAVFEIFVESRGNNFAFNIFEIFVESRGNNFPFNIFAINIFP